MIFSRELLCCRSETDRDYIQIGTKHIGNTSTGDELGTCKATVCVCCGPTNAMHAGYHYSICHSSYVLCLIQAEALCDGGRQG